MALVVYAALILSSSIGISLTYTPFGIFDSFLSHLPAMSARGSSSMYEAVEKPKYEAADDLYRHAVKILGDYVGEEHTGAFKVLDDTSRTYSNRTDLERALMDCNHALMLLDSPPEAKLDLLSLRGKVFLMLDEWDKAEEDAHQALNDIRDIIQERHPFEQYAFEMDSSSTDTTTGLPLNLEESDSNVCIQSSDPLLSMEENERKEFGFPSTTTTGGKDDFLILKIKEGVLMNELAEVKRMQAKLGKPTEELLHQALRLFEKDSKRRQEGATVHDGSNTASARANLGSFYMHTGRLAEAEKYHREALAQRERLFGKNHPEIAASLEALSGVLYRQAKDGITPEKHEEADECLCRALRIIRRTLGEKSREYQKLAPYVLTLRHHQRCLEDESGDKKE